MTFSIAARCARTGQLGIAVTTSSICVGSRCPWVRTAVGAVSTQNITLPEIGPRTLDGIAAGESGPAALQRVMAGSVDAAYRQVIAIDHQGRTAHHSGEHTLGVHAVHSGLDCIAGGNMLRSTELPAAVVENFEQQPERALPERLMAALETGLYQAGGEAGPVHSAALLVSAEQSWPLVDLRIDWDDDDPVSRLRRLWVEYEPQMQDYVTRALDPASAPSYGVPGDL